MTMLDAITAHPKKKKQVTLNFDTPFSPYAAGSSSEMQTYVIMPEANRMQHEESIHYRFLWGEFAISMVALASRENGIGTI